MSDIESYVAAIGHEVTTPNYLGFQQMNTTSNTVIHISAPDAEKRLLARLTIVLIVAMNISLGMAQHSNKFNT